MKCCDLTPGALRHRVDIQREIGAEDAAGGRSLAWATIASPRCFIKPTSGGERFYSMRLEANISHRIFMRYRPDLLPSDRINYKGRLMQIRALINIEERNKWLEIYAEEGKQT